MFISSNKKKMSVSQVKVSAFQGSPCLWKNMWKMAHSDPSTIVRVTCLSAQLLQEISGFLKAMLIWTLPPHYCFFTQSTLFISSLQHFYRDDILRYQSSLLFPLSYSQHPFFYCSGRRNGIEQTTVFHGTDLFSLENAQQFWFVSVKGAGYIIESLKVTRSLEETLLWKLSHAAHIPTYLCLFPMF